MRKPKMSSVVDINEFATYGLMAQGLDEYFTNASDTKYTPPGGFYQNYHMKTKKKKYNKDAIPNAWVKEDSNLYFNQQDGEKKSISDFINKDEKTLKYFWEWAQNNEGKGDDGLPANTKDSNPSIVRIDPSWGMDAVPGYKYTKNKFDHINYNDRINMYTLGEDGISTDNIKKLGYNPETNDTQSKLQVTDIEYKAYEESYNEIPTSTGKSEDSDFKVSISFKAVVNQAQEVYVAGEFQNSITNATSSTTETSSTEEQEFEVGVTVSYSAQVGPEVAQSTYSASLESSYNQSWENTKTLSYSEDESTTNTSTVGISYTSTITPTPTTSTEDNDEALSIDVYNQEYTIEAGDDVVIDTTFAKGIYNADLKAPYFLSGPVGTYTFGTITTNDGDGKLYTEAWQGGGQPREISSNIGKAAKWANLYDWQSAFDVENEDVEITQWEEDGDLAYVDNASTVTTGAGAYFVINTYITKGIQDGGSSNISLRKSAKEDIKDSNISYSDKVRNRFKEIGINKLPYTFNIGGVNDLGAELEKTAERLKLSEDAKKTLPGYYVKQKMEGDSIIILPDRVNHLDISKSKGKSLVLAESGRGRIATGSANDIIATNKGSLQTIRTGSGADIVYSLGNGDNIDVGDGKDSVYALGENAFIKLGNGKNESVFLGDKTKVQLFNFKPGSTRLGASSLAKSGERIENFKANNFKLRETESGDTFRITDRSGNQRGNIELHHSKHTNKGSMWLDYALKYRSGKLIDKLISNRDTITLSKQDILLNDFGSHLKSILINDLNTLSEEGKKVFLKRGFAEGSKHYELDYSHEGGKKISDALTNWISSTVDNLKEAYSDKERSQNFDSIDNVQSMISTAVYKAAGGRHGHYWLAGKAPEDHLGNITSAIAQNFN